MTTQEIKDLVAAKIAGQGNQIDLGNALPEIIDALCDAVDSATSSITTSYQETGAHEGTKSEAATALGIKEERVDDLFSGRFAVLKIKNENANYLLHRLVSGDIDDGSCWVKYGTKGAIVGVTVELFFDAEGSGNYSWSIEEV